MSRAKAADCRSATGYDEGILARARSGDEWAFRRIYEDHRLNVARLVYRLVSPRSDVEMLVQSVFVQIHGSIGTFRGESRLSTWVHQVTVDVVRMHLRAKRRRPLLAVDAPDERHAPSPDMRPDEDLARRERMRAFERLLARLAEKKRIVFVLHELEGLSPNEIAKIVRAPVMTVRTRLFYARKELEGMLRDEPALDGL